MRHLLYIILFAAAGSLVYCTKQVSSERPNIVLIISDDQGWTDYGFMGHPYLQTPHINRLAEEGLTFTRGYSAAPLCRPSLASIATGLYPHQHGVVGNDPLFEFDRTNRSAKEWLMALSEKNEPIVASFGRLETLADLLAEAGYISLQTGKWWEGDYSTGGFTEGMTHGDPERGGRHGDDGLEIGRNGMEVIFDFIRRAGKADQPFFIWYAPFMPHSPHTPPDSLVEKYLPIAPTLPVANYNAMCEWFDITIGQLVDFVDGEGLGESTLFIYVTDNGWIQDPERANRYAERSKRSPYEMGIRTPIIYRWKETINPEMDETTLASSIDIVPTILKVCGIEKPEEMQGINVLDRSQKESRDAIFAEAYAHDFTSVDSSLHNRIILSGQWKLIVPDPVNLPEQEIELFNILDDPYELENVSEENPDIVSGLMKKIESWWRI